MPEDGSAEDRWPCRSNAGLIPIEPGNGRWILHVPWFWSDQYDRKLQVAGRTSPDAELRVVAGSVADRKFVALYGLDGRITAVLGMNMPAAVMRWRKRMVDAVPWDEALPDS